MFSKYPWPHKYPVKNNTMVNNNTTEATTQIPLKSPTSTSTKIVPSPSVTPLTQNVASTSAREKVTTDSFAAIPSPHSSPIPLEDTAAALTSFTTTPTQQSISTPLETTLPQIPNLIFLQPYSHLKLPKLQLNPQPKLLL